MMHGLDTGFLVAAEVTEHAEHGGARATLARLLGTGDLSFAEEDAKHDHHFTRRSGAVACR